MCLWALGREAFGIKPARPLKFIYVQRENDDGDLQELTSGACDHFGFSDQEREIIRRNVISITERALSGDKFLAQLRHLIRKHKPDIVWIDPLQAYAGGDFHTGYPGFFDLALVLVGSHDFARVHASLRQFLRERCCAIITSGKCLFSARVDPLPEVFFALFHLPIYPAFVARNWRVRERNSSTCVSPSLMQLVAARVQDYFAVSNFPVRYSILVGIFDHVTSQRSSNSW